MSKAPCKDCEERHEGCHSECKKYQEYRKKRDKMLKNRSEKITRDMYQYESVVRMIKRARGHKR